MNKYLKQIHQIENKPLVNIVTTGGGFQFIKDIGSVTGASNIINRISIPYNKNATDKFLKTLRVIDLKKFENFKYCSQESASLLNTAQYYEIKNTKQIYIAISASLNNGTQIKPQREDRINQAFISIITNKGIYEENIVFDNKLSRIKQENKLSNHLMKLLFKCYNNTLNYIVKVYRGNMLDILSPTQPLYTKFYSGSFNPWHKGHSFIANNSIDSLHKNIVIEIAENAYGKDATTNIEERLNKIPKKYKLVLSTPFTFMTEKAAFFYRYSMSLKYIMGLDTLMRISTDDIKILINKYEGLLDVFNRDVSSLYTPSIIKQKINQIQKIYNKWHVQFKLIDGVPSISSTNIRNKN